MTRRREKSGNSRVLEQSYKTRGGGGAIGKGEGGCRGGVKSHLLLDGV